MYERESEERARERERESKREGGRESKREGERGKERERVCVSMCVCASVCVSANNNRQAGRPATQASIIQYTSYMHTSKTLSLEEAATSLVQLISIKQPNTTGSL